MKYLTVIAFVLVFSYHNVFAFDISTCHDGWSYATQSELMNSNCKKENYPNSNTVRNIKNATCIVYIKRALDTPNLKSGWFRQTGTLIANDLVVTAMHGFNIHKKNFDTKFIVKDVNDVRVVFPGDKEVLDYTNVDPKDYYLNNCYDVEQFDPVPKPIPLWQKGTDNLMANLSIGNYLNKDWIVLKLKGSHTTASPAQPLLDWPEGSDVKADNIFALHFAQYEELPKYIQLSYPKIGSKQLVSPGTNSIFGLTKKGVNIYGTGGMSGAGLIFSSSTDTEKEGKIIGLCNETRNGYVESVTSIYNLFDLSHGSSLLKNKFPSSFKNFINDEKLHLVSRTPLALAGMNFSGGFDNPNASLPPYVFGPIHTQEDFVWYVVDKYPYQNNQLKIPLSELIPMSNLPPEGRYTLKVKVRGSISALKKCDSDDCEHFELPLPTTVIGNNGCPENFGLSLKDKSINELARIGLFYNNNVYDERRVLNDNLITGSTFGVQCDERSNFRYAYSDLIEIDVCNSKEMTKKQLEETSLIVQTSSLRVNYNETIDLVHGFSLHDVRLIYEDEDNDNVAWYQDNCLKKDNDFADWYDMYGKLHTAEQPDFDLDGIGDLCDKCEADEFNDFDGDGLCAYIKSQNGTERIQHDPCQYSRHITEQSECVDVLSYCPDMVYNKAALENKWNEERQRKPWFRYNVTISSFVGFFVSWGDEKLDLYDIEHTHFDSENVEGLYRVDAHKPGEIVYLEHEYKTIGNFEFILWQCYKGDDGQGNTKYAFNRVIDYRDNFHLVSTGPADIPPKISSFFVKQGYNNSLTSLKCYLDKNSGAISGASIDWGDGSRECLIGARKVPIILEKTHVYEQAGNYQARIILYGSDETLFCDAIANVEIIENAPEIQINETIIEESNDLVKLQFNAKNLKESLNGPLFGHKWAFSNGLSSDAESPIISINKSINRDGLIGVKLTASSNFYVSEAQKNIAIAARVEPESNACFLHTLNRILIVDVTEVTQASYNAVMMKNPSINTTVGKWGPVENVTLLDAVLYCNKRSVQDGFCPVYSFSSSKYDADGSCIELANLKADFKKNGYRLPTTREWKEIYLAGTLPTANDGCYWTAGSINDYAWNYNNSGTPPKTHVVGSKVANAFGLYDMSGNVSEWVWIEAAFPFTTTLSDGTMGTGFYAYYRSGANYSYSDFDGISIFGVNGLSMIGAHCKHETVGFRVVRNAPDITPVINLLLLH